MVEADFYGKLLPTHPDIMDILRDIRSEYDIPEISPQDDSLRVLLKLHLGSRRVTTDADGKMHSRRVGGQT